jgi:hypothetical protein
MGVLVGDVGEDLVTLGAREQRTQEQRGQAGQARLVVHSWPIHSDSGWRYFYIVESSRARPGAPDHT